jgi:hypothetical protein
MYVLYKSKNLFYSENVMLYLGNMNKNGITFLPSQNKGILITPPVHGQKHRCPVAEY